MKDPNEVQPDPDKDLSLAEAMKQKRIVESEARIEPKSDVQEVPGSLSRESAGE